MWSEVPAMYGTHLKMHHKEHRTRRNARTRDCLLYLESQGSYEFVINQIKDSIKEQFSHVLSSTTVVYVIVQVCVITPPNNLSLSSPNITVRSVFTILHRRSWSPVGGF